MRIEYCNKKDTFLKKLFLVLYLVYGGCCTILYYRQSIMYKGNYYSDLMAHIRSGISKKHSYSIATKIYGILYNITKDTRLIAVFLAFVSVFTLFGVYFMLKTFLERQGVRYSSSVLLMYSLACGFTMSVFVPSLYPHSYIGTISGQAWHNSTYLQMRFLGLLIIILYFKIEEMYLERIVLWQALLFVFGLIVVNLIKPNFILAFAPMMAINLCIDLVSVKLPMKNKLRQIILFGLCVLPSLVVLLIQNQVLYSGDSESGIAIDIGYSFLRTGNPYAKIILGLAFPLIVLFMNYKDVTKDKIYGSIWMMWLVSFCEYGIFIETGKRMNHGNFAWGMIFCTFLVFVISVYKILCNQEQRKIRKGYYYLAYGVFVCHVISGLYYFVQLMQGESYML